MSSVSSVQFTGLQNTNGYNTNTEKSEKSFAKTGAAIGALGGTVTSGLILSSKKGRESWSCLMEFARRSGAGKGTIAASVATAFAIIAGAGALIGLGAGAIVKAVNKHGSTGQNTANTETKTIDKEA